MSNDFVIFNIRYEKSLCELKINTPGNVSEFIEKLKNELKLEETDKLVILCPTHDGKMMEIQSDDDIDFLKKTKLAYNAITKEIYCNVELVVILINELPDDTNTQVKILSNKFDKLASKVDEFSDEINKKLDDNKTDILSTIRSILDEHLQIDSGNKSKNTTLGSLIGEEDPDIKSILGQRQKKPKKDKEKLSSTNGTSASGTNDNSSTTFENLMDNRRSNVPTSAPRLIPKDIDVLLEMLIQDGYTNTIQNIIVLKRFDNDYEKAKNYLKSSST